MKKIYQHSYVYDTDELVAWEYKGYRIELDYTECRSYLNPWRRCGYIVPALKEIGVTSWCETLKEAKEMIDKYLIKEVQ